jgi:hypothetical protein
MSNCKHCGTQLPEHATSCPTCASSIVDRDLYAPTDTVIRQDDDAPENSEATLSYFVNLDITDIIMASFRIWYRNFRRLAGLSAINYASIIPLIILLILMATDIMDSDTLEVAMGIAGILTAVILWPLSAVCWAAGLLTLKDDVQGTNRFASTTDAFTAGIPFLARLLLGGLVYIAMFSLICAPALVAAVLKIWPLLIIYLPLGLGGMMYLFIRWAVAFQSIVIEDQSVISGFLASSGLVRGHWWIVLGAYVVFFMAMGTLQSPVMMVAFIPIIGQLISFAAGFLFFMPVSYSFSFAIYSAMCEARKK